MSPEILIETSQLSESVETPTFPPRNTSPSDIFGFRMTRLSRPEASGHLETRYVLSKCIRNLETVRRPLHQTLLALAKREVALWPRWRSRCSRCFHGNRLAPLHNGR